MSKVLQLSLLLGSILVLIFVIKNVLKNKINSLLNKPLCLEKKWYDVGQDPEQGNLQK